ncbi:MAG: adenosine deaminase [Acidobacteria bacterium]|nr:adenosine deaminase [Acidobacteriota bacterium]
MKIHTGVFARALASLFILLCAAVPTLAQATAETDREARTARYLESLRQQPLLLQAFLREMPKGGDLHNHYAGSAYAESFIGFGAHDGFCVERKSMGFVSPPCDASGGRVPASDALRDPALYGELIDAFSLRNWSPARDSGHDHFFATFLKFEPVIAAHRGEIIAELASRAAAENLLYLELLTDMGEQSAIRLGGQVPWADDFDRMRQRLLSGGMARVLAETRRNIEEATADRRSTLRCNAAQPDPGCQVVVRYLFQVLRGFPPAQVFAQLVEGFELAQLDSRVVGVNMVMPEDWYIPVRDYDLQMRMVEYLHRVYPKVHISLHAGELAPGLVAPETLRFHVREAVERGHAERIGHGVDVMWERDPLQLMDEMAKKNVLVEICLTSNDVILGVRGPEHPLPLYMKHNVPVALATDDSGVSRTDAMTHEYVRAVQDFGLGYTDLKHMARASLEHSFLAGPSLWADATATNRVASCSSDDANQSQPSASCQKFLQSSDRARAQWALEQAFVRFESRRW